MTDAKPMTATHCSEQRLHDMRADVERGVSPTLADISALLHDHATLRAENARHAAVVERQKRQADATDNLIRAAISTADFIEGEYADGNDDGDIIPVSSPAYKIHERLWGAIFKADLPDGATTVAVREAALATRGEQP